MFIMELDTADESRLRQRAKRCGRGAEVYVDEDGGGGLIVCDAKACRARKGTRVHRVETCFTAGDFGRKGGRHLLFVGAWTPDDYRTEFAAWYEIDHVPLLLASPTWDGCRVVEEKVAKGAQFYSLHQVSDLAAFDSEERKQARDTPWFHRLQVHDWFDEGFTRCVYRRLGR